MRYLVLVPEFRWNGRALKAGDFIEADNTTEILTNVALGRLAPGADVVAEPRPAMSSPVPAADPGPMPEFLERPEPAKRRYMRRDLQAE